jgi:hypothetical protein
MEKLHYYSKLHDKSGKYANKQGMVDWLQTNGYLAATSKKKILPFLNEKQKPT